MKKNEKCVASRTTLKNDVFYEYALYSLQALWFNVVIGFSKF